MYINPSLWTRVTHEGKVHLLIHQASHIFGTTDESFGSESCRRLARRDTEGAALNADNYAYFVRNPTNLEATRGVATLRERERE